MEIKFAFLNRVSSREKALFTRSLSATISSGLPIVRSLSILSRQTKNKYFSSVIEQLIKRLEEGEKLSTALSRYPKIFDRVYIASVAAAEASGKFEQILKDLADRQEKEYKLESAVKGAVAYPIFAVCAMIVTAVILLILVVPKIQSIFEESDITLPWSTRALLATANFFSSYWYLILLILAGLGAWLWYYLKSKQGKLFWGKFTITFPVIREIFVNVYMARFSKTFGMLIAAGVPIVQAVDLVGEVLNNEVYKRILHNASQQLERGVPMSVPLSQSPEFPPIVSQMIAVGEQTGKIDEIMTSLSGFFEEESSKNVTTITSLLEPILLIIVGLGVGLIVFSIIVPLYQISATIK